MSDIEFRPVTVAMEDGPCQGRLVFSGGELIAVFSHVPAGNADREGWFCEVGFGPCSDLFVAPPERFATLDDARAWVGKKIEDRKPTA